MLDHNRALVHTLQADRLAARRRLPADAGELERLMQAASTGDSAAWSRLMQRFATRLRAVVRRHRLAAEDAEDVVQATWLRLFERIDGVREPGAVGAWLETTARHECLRVLRSAQRECPTASEQLPDQPITDASERALEAAEVRAALAEAMTGLSESQRRLAAMLFAEAEPSYVEISQELGIPIGSIGPTRSRILARLRRDPGLARVLAGEPDFAV